MNGNNPQIKRQREILRFCFHENLLNRFPFDEISVGYRIANSENRFKSNSSKLGVNINAIFLLRSILRFDSNAYLMTHDNIFRQPNTQLIQ